MLYPVELRAPRLELWHRPRCSTNGPRSESGRGRGIRTPDILLPKQARYQTALYPGRLAPREPAGARNARNGADSSSHPACPPAARALSVQDARKLRASRLWMAVAAMAAWPVPTLIWLMSLTTSPIAYSPSTLVHWRESTSRSPT